MKIKFIFIFILIFFFTITCKLKNEEDKKKEELFQTLLLDSINSDCKSYYFPEEVTFTELQKQNVFENCISCHNSNQHEGNLDLTDYSQTKNRVVPYNPEQSLLYQKITQGSMAKYSNTCINNAIKKWIELGAKE